MAALEEVEQAFMRAHAAGDKKNAQVLADEVRRLRSAAAPPSAARQVEGESAPAVAAPSEGVGTEAGQAVRMMPVVGAIARAVDMAGGPGMVDTAADEAVNQATFGLSRKGAAFLDSLTGGDTYKQALDYRERRARDMNAENPGSSWVGYGAGMLGGGVGLAKAGAALAPRAAAALTPQAGEGLLRTGAKLAGAGAAGGAAESAITGTGDMVADLATGGGETSLTNNPVTKALGGGLIGGLAGPAAGAAAHGALRGGQALLDRLTGRELGAWRLLAQKLGIEPEAAKAAADNMARHTGQEPNLAMLLKARDQGVLREMSEANHTLGERMLAAQREAQEALPGQYQRRVEAITGEPVQTAAGLKAGKTADDTAFFQAPNPGGGTRQDLPVQLTRAEVEDLLSHPMAAQLLRGNNNPAMLAKVQAANEMLAHPNATRFRGFTLNDIENLRGAVRRQGQGPNGFDREAAQELGDQLIAIGERSHPGYAARMAEGRATHEFTAGFKRGEKVKADIDVTGAPTLTGDRAEGFASGLISGSVQRAKTGARGAVNELNRVESQAFQEAMGGYLPQGQREALTDAARAFRQGQEALDAAAPRGFGQSAGDAAEDAGALAGSALSAVTGHPLGAAFGLRRFLFRPGSDIRMPEGMQVKVADGLLSRDPRVRDQSLRLLERAGADARTIREVRTAVAAMAGADAERNY